MVVSGAWKGRVERLARHASSGGAMAGVVKGVDDAVAALKARLDNTMLRELEADPREEECFPNRRTRPVATGHYVRIAPTPLADPFLVSYSEDMARRLGLGKAQVESEGFVQVFSAGTHRPEEPNRHLESWCTPYAVSVHGMPIEDPCGMNGRAYGDGRACSIGEFKGEAEGERWELQLKGCGPTPFSRQFDGRAVLRSSVREFLVSEAMFALGVPTTRALSLVASVSESVPRAWYKPGVVSKGFDFPPNVMIEEQCAITCRAASSFLRVGQVELYERRLARGDDGAKAGFIQFMRHCIKREFPTVELPAADAPLGPALVGMLREFARRHAALVQGWLRVGYVQGNMNSDNCLLAGLTMDYGPFGFVERYSPLWTPFTSDPDRKFGFERQPLAMHINVATLAQAILPLLDGDEELVGQCKRLVQEEFSEMLVKERSEMRRRKLGLSEWAEGMDEELWEPLFKILPGLDYTLFWRELSGAPRAALDTDDDEQLAALVARAVYDAEEAASPARRDALCAWLRKWRACLDEDAASDEERQAVMKAANPKYIPREWMLVQAYEAAKKQDYSVLEVLKGLFATPYAEHKDLEEDFYRTTPPDLRRRAGVAFFSCSS